MPDLIVNADDFGRSAGINRGILEAHQGGIVTSTTAMMNYPAVVPGLETALEVAPDLGIGVHLNLTSGRPLLPPESVPTLVDADGRFYGPAALPHAGRRWAADDLHRELSAQVDHFLRVTGRPPTHLDSHHGAALVLPEALRVTLSLAAKYSIPIRRPPLADTAQQTARDSWVLSRFPDDHALEVADELHAIMDAHPGVRMPDRFVSSFYDRLAILGELLVILTTLPSAGVTELMCHPGYADGLDSPYAAPRERELAALVHHAAHEVVAAENIRLMTFTELPR